jgi:uncharacterized protein
MKYLLVLAVVVIGIWLWRKGREEELRERAPPRARRSLDAPTETVRCAHCGLHLPAADAVPGGAGRVYCGAAHRAAAERNTR